ncbi:hypothetical protein Fmac_006732 [Flemingia macrophylla]|uniref:Transmembrane protein n=1 Tax=Flemingia macrophylla TaxID=520843 RepID=A0ABD1NBF4_9FABA
MIMENKRQGKHPLISSLSIGGEGGITGLLVFGGALAFAGFMAVASFASNKQKAKDHHPKPKPKPQQDHDIDTLTSLIQIPHGDATCCWTPTPDMSMKQAGDSSELTLEDKSEGLEETRGEESQSLHDQEIVFSDYSPPESALPQEVEKDEEPQHDRTSEDDQQDDGDMTSKDVSEVVSKVTGTTTLEEPVWHATQKLKGTDSDVDASDSDHTIAVAKKAAMYGNLNVLMVPSYQPLTWFFPLLLLALLVLLVLLTHRPQESFYVLDEANSLVKPI